MFRPALTASRLALAHAGAHPGRLVYLVLTLAVTVVAWLGLAALASPFVHADIPDAGGVAVFNTREGNTLPLRYAARIVALQETTDVTYMNFVPVVCRAPTVAATLNGYGGPGTHRALVEAGVDEVAMMAWNADPLGILVGSALAANCGWKAGMGIQPLDVSGRPVEIHIVGVFHSTQPYADQIAFAHYEYINRLREGPLRDQVNAIIVNASNPRDSSLLAARIEATFVHDDPPVRAVTSTMADNALSRFGHVQVLLAWVMSAVFASTLLMLVSVLAHAAAQRRAIMAVLQVLGFRRRLLFGSFLLECVAMIAAGAAVGLVIGKIVLRALAPKIAPLLGRFEAPPWAYHYLPLWLLVLLVASLVLPAMIVARTRPIDYPDT